MLFRSAGVIFSVVLAVSESRRRFDQMSLPRFAGWGAAGGLALFGAFALTAGPAGEPLFLAPLLALAGAGSATGTLALARNRAAMSSPARFGLISPIAAECGPAWPVSATGTAVAKLEGG